MDNGLEKAFLRQDPQMVNVLVTRWHPPEAKDVPPHTDWGGNKVESQAAASAGDGVGNQ